MGTNINKSTSSNNSLIGQNAQFIKMPDPFRLAEYQAIGAVKIPDEYITPLGAIYHPNFKTKVGDKDTIDYIMKSINSITKTKTGFTGFCIGENGFLYQFEVDIENKKLKNIAGRKTIRFKARGLEQRARFRWAFMGKYLNASTLIACLELLANGYMVDDWNILQVNHRDNSAGVEYHNKCLPENLNPDNLELFVEPRLNRRHGQIWEDLNELNILSSFSLYNKDFKKFINGLDESEQLTKENVMSWRKKRIDISTGIVYFD